MVARNQLISAPPYAVEQTLKRLGGALRRARLRRKMTIEDAAQKIGTGYRAVADAEKGKPSASMATYAALLWAYDLLGELDAIADLSADAEGQALALSREPKRARAAKRLDDDF